MLEIKSKTSDKQEAKNNGLLVSRRNLESKNIYDKLYSKFKLNNNKYLDDDMWSIAATKGELDQLVYNLDTNENKYLDQLQQYGDAIDYDTYMLALAMPKLDNTTKKTRLSGDGLTNFGDMTDLEWAEKILEATTNRVEAELMKEQKENHNWWQKAGATLVSGGLHVITGATGAIQNIYNLGEGIYNIVTGEKFLEAWADDEDEALANAYEQLKYATYAFDVYFTPTADPVKAYEEGFVPVKGDYDVGSKAFTQAIKESGYGGGYKTWGRWWSSGLESIGEMLPYMFIPAGKSAALTKALRTGGFYIGNVMSSGIKDTVITAEQNGISYKDLNAGEVVANAALKATGQYLMEVLTGKILGFTGLDKMLGIGDEVVGGASRWFIKAASSTGAKAVGVAVGRGLLSMAKEGLEETLQDLSDGIIDTIFGNITGNELYSNRGNETITWQNMIDAFVVGALTSGVIGSLSSASVLLDRKSRNLGVDAAGNVYKLGFFEQLNYNQAMQAMASWQKTIYDAKASVQEKTDAAFRLNGVMSTVGNVLKTFGTERSQKAIELLTQYQNKLSTEEQKNEAKKQLSSVNFATQLYNDFVNANKEAAAKYLNDKLANKLKNALEKDAKRLQKQGVTELKDLVTQETEVVDEASDVPTQNIKNVKSLLKQTGSDMLVATNGTGVVKSGDVIFAPDSLLKTGNVSAILEGIAYDKALKVIAPELNKKQVDLVLTEYKRLTAREDADIEDALIALLFDRSFYTYILLKANETQSINDANDAIKILAIMDRIVKGKISGEVEKGTLTQAAYQKLVKRIQENMRAGLLVYATTYTNIDLDAISGEILPGELKTIIRNNQNVIFTKAINDCLESKQKGVITEDRITEFDRQIDKFKGINKAYDDMINTAKQKIRSTEYNDRFDACGLLRYLLTLNDDLQLIYLKPDNPNKTIDDSNKIITLVTEFFDSEWDDIIAGKISLIDLPPDAQHYVQKTGYDLTNYNDRIAMLRDRIYVYSNNTLTVSHDGEILQVLEKKKLVKDEYLSANGSTKLIEDIKSGKVSTIKDICKVTINKTIGDITIIYNSSVDANGYFDDNRPDTIVVNGTDIVNTIMHEATHATQYFTRSKQSNTIVTGANMTALTHIPGSTLDDIDEYLSEKFPLIYKAMLMNTENDIPEIIYFNVEGEMQAMCKLTSLVFETGFTWSHDKSVLHSPDGKKQWTLKIKTDNKTISEDRPLKHKEVSNLKDNKEIMSFMKDGYLKNSDGSPIVFYRFSVGKNGQLEGNNRMTESTSPYIYLSTEPVMEFSEYSGIDTLQGYVSNLTNDELLIIDVNDNWTNIKLNKETIKNKPSLVRYYFTDQYNALSNIFNQEKRDGNAVADLIMQLKEDTKLNKHLTNELKNIKGIYLLNIKEGGSGEQVTNDLILLDKSAIKRVTVEDNYKFMKDYANDTIMNGRYEDRHNREYIKQYIEEYPTDSISESRKLSNKEAQQSNLKYFIKPGKQIQLDERVQQFVVDTTNDFDKLEPVIQKAIKNGTLTLIDIQNYVETANSINDYTFRMIAEYIYNNEEVAKLTFNDMINILNNLEKIDVLKLAVNNKDIIDKPMSFDRMMKAYNKLEEQAKSDPKVAEKLAGFTNLASTLKPEGSRQFLQYTADPDQLHGAFFRHYNGTIRSVSGLNNYGKNIAHNQEALALGSNEGSGANLKSRKGGVWNWIDRIRKADINYGNVEQLNETLSDLDRQDKINIIQEHIIQSIIAESKTRQLSQEEVIAEFTEQRNRLDDLTDAEIDKLYIAATSEGIVETTPDYMNIKTELEKRYTRKTTKEYEGKYASRVTARATAKNVGKRIAIRLAGLKTRFNSLPEEIKQFFDRNSYSEYEFNTKYQELSDAELNALIPIMQEASKNLSERMKIVEAAKKSKLRAIQRANRQAEKMLDKPDSEKKTMREKINVVHKVVLKQEEFNIVSREQAPKIVESVLGTSWDKTRTTTVQGLDNNIEQNIANAETFYTTNPDMLNMSVNEAEQASKWFMDAKLTGTMTSQDMKKFEAIQLYFLGYVLSETRENGQFADLNKNVKTQIETFLRDRATGAGTALAVWNNIRKRLNPIDVMLSQSITIGGVELSESEQRELIEATTKGDMETVAKLQERILERIKKEQTGNRGILRRVTAVRSMSMLSSPLTWLRNKVSNFMLKRLNKWSSNIGNRIFTSKTKEGQLRFTGNITPEIQTFINTNFVDNKMFETLIANISKYNPSDVSKRFKNVDGSIDKNAILANMIVKSMYGKYYTENMFKSDFMNKIYQGLMKMMSDNNYVREAAIRYFGKIIAEKNYDLSKGVTDAIMTDFANAIGIAMSDYMHSDNFFNTLEAIAAEHGETTLFLYKNLVPFMATSWNWFKAAIRYSPIGLARSIVKLTRLENEVRKQESRWDKGKSQVAPEYTEYLIRRDLGSGVIGTMAFMLGILLSALGFIDLDDEDYGTPKLVIGDIKIDISSIFGTSSVLAGAALITDMKHEGVSWKTFMSGLDKTLDVTLDGFFLTELMALDLYSGGGSFATVLDILESFILSFIPNGLAWAAGATYTGTLRKKGLFGKAAAKIPFLASIVNEKKVDPYTGETGNIWDIFNRIMPYFDVKMTSRAKATAESLGLSKSELKGQYKINGEEFNLSDKEVTEINKQYGNWNAKDLTAFLDNKEKYKVKDDETDTYKMLTYSQMTDKQRKNTIANIMENNAENAKILAWLNAGYSYYASANKYAELKKLGVKGKLYKGNKSFVKK